MKFPLLFLPQTSFFKVPIGYKFYPLGLQHQHWSVLRSQKNCSCVPNVLVRWITYYQVLCQAPYGWCSMWVAKQSYDRGSIIPTFQMRKPRLQKLEKVPKVTHQWFGRPDTWTHHLLSQLSVPSPLPWVLKSTVFHPSHGTEEGPEGSG